MAWVALVAAGLFETGFAVCLKKADGFSRLWPTVGFCLFALTVPVAVHCLIAYGVQLTSLRVAIHSIAGCFFYGAFVAKVLLVRSRRLPGWVLPVAGGTLATIIGVLWYTAALWYYKGQQLPRI